MATAIAVDLCLGTATGLMFIASMLIENHLPEHEVTVEI